MTSEPTDGKYEQTEQLTFELQFVWRGTSRKPLRQMMNAARQLLQNATLEVEGVAFESMNWLGDALGDSIADGVTYVGISNYGCMAEPL